MSDLSIDMESVDALIPYVGNSRTHSDEQVAQIAASIKEFGWVNPILIDGDNVIIAGHGRLLAARKLKMEEVPAIRIGHLSKAQQKALVIADNKLALNAGWDYDVLSSQIAELLEGEFDLTLLGFSEVELEALEDDLDLSILDALNNEDLSEHEGAVKKAIQIEFDPSDYDDAQELVKFWRERGEYVGGFLIATLRNEKAKL